VVRWVKFLGASDLVERKAVPRSRLVLLVAAASLLVMGGVLVGNVSAHPKVHESVQVQVSLFAEKGADGTITEKVTFTASNPRCFSAKNFKRLRDGYFHGAGGDLLFNGGAGLANPPENGWLHPSSTSAFGRSPYTWEAVYPGGMSISVEEPINSNRFYTTTVSNATEASIEGTFPTKEVGYVKYTAEGRRHIVLCARRSKARIIEL
jgi:hypothetical protein